MNKASSTRDRVLEVGLRQLRLAGYNATGVKDVLDLAGVPKGSFYHYFTSKEAFAGELIEKYAEAEIERVHRILGDLTIAPLKRLRSYFEDLSTTNGIHAEVSGCLIGSMSLEVAGQNEILQVQLRSLFEVWQQAIADVLHEAVKRGDLDGTLKPTTLAEFLLSSYEGALVRMKADRSNRPLDNFIHVVFNVILNNKQER